MNQLLIGCYIINLFLSYCVLCSNNQNKTSETLTSDNKTDLLVDNSQRIVVPVVYSVENRHLWRKPQPFGNSASPQVTIPPTLPQLTSQAAKNGHNNGAATATVLNSVSGIRQQPDKILKRPVSFSYQIRSDLNSSPTLQYYGTKGYYDDLMRLQNQTHLLELTTVVPKINPTDKIAINNTEVDKDETDEDDEEYEDEDDDDEEEEESTDEDGKVNTGTSSITTQTGDKVKSDENIDSEESKKSLKNTSEETDEDLNEGKENDDDEEDEEEETEDDDKNKHESEENLAGDKESTSNDKIDRKLRINKNTPLDKHRQYLNHGKSDEDPIIYKKNDKHSDIYIGHDGYKKLLESRELDRKRKPAVKSTDDINEEHLKEYHGDTYPFKPKKYINHKYDDDADSDPEDHEYRQLLDKSKKIHEKLYKNNANKYIRLQEKTPTESRRVQESQRKSSKPRKNRKPRYRIIRVYDDDEDYEDDLLDYQPDPVNEYQNHKLPTEKSKRTVNNQVQNKNHPKFKPLFNDEHSRNDQETTQSDKITKKLVILKPNLKNDHLTKPLRFKEDLNIQAESRANTAEIKHAHAAGDNKAQASGHHEKKKHHKGPKKFKKGGGKEHKSEHHSHHGEKGEKGYKGYHKHEKGQKGHHDKEGHKGSYEDHGGHKKKHHHDEGHFGGHKKGEEGEKGAKYEEHGKHEKGHSTKGEHNIHKKDEYEKKHEFFDEYHEGGESEKHGGFHEEHEGHKGGSHKGGHHKSGYDHSEKGKKGKSEKGGHYDEDKGHKHEEGHEHHHHHSEKYGKKEAKDSGKKYGYKKGKRR